jgi:hypothetical protein
VPAKKVRIYTGGNTTRMANSLRPAYAYKAIVDQLVNETMGSVTQQVLTERGYFPKTSDNAVFNELVRALRPEERRLLGNMLLRERSDTIHDVLAVLTDWMLTTDSRLRFKANLCRSVSAAWGCTATSQLDWTAGSGQTIATITEQLRDEYCGPLRIGRHEPRKTTSHELRSSQCQFRCAVQ